MPDGKTPAPKSLLGKASRAGAEEALASLVHQFTQTLAFLRELVQNSLDASSTIIEVGMGFEAAKPSDSDGLVTVSVVDNGEGMTEAIIDNYLLTLFRSTKEDDLTKIGKFGIGFVSVFALEPDLVVVDTGRAGESWRIVFHADHHFEKLRLNEPVEGTTVRLFKRMPRKDYDDLKQQAHEVVRYWCRYADAEIRVDGESIREAFGLDSPLCIHHKEPGTEIWVGLAPRGQTGEPMPTVGFYNRGLTLVEGRGVPGDHPRLRGLSLKVRSRYLEHTLTRDNVRQDQQFDRLMALVVQQVKTSLSPRLLAHMCKLAGFHSGGVQADDPGPPASSECFWHTLGLGLHPEGEPIFPTIEAGPLQWDQVRAAASGGEVLMASRSNPVTRRLHEDGVVVLLQQRGLVHMLNRMGGIAVRDVNEAYLTSLPVEADGADARLPGLLESLLAEGGIRVERVVLGDLEYPGSQIAAWLYLRQKKVHELIRPGDNRATRFGGARNIVLNIRHRLVEQGRKLAGSDPALAALLLAQAIFAQEEGDWSKRLSRMATRSLTPEPEDRDG